MPISRSELKVHVMDVLNVELADKSKKEREHIAGELLDKMVLEFAGDVYEDDDEGDEEDEALDDKIAGHLSSDDDEEA